MSRADNVVNFTSNLKLLCSYYKSISEVCRKICINRQQFNRYLNGTTFPAYGNLQRICDFFGVDQEEILLNHSAFKKKVSPVATDSDPNLTLPSELIQQLVALKNISQGSLDRYLGYYYRYIHSGAFPGSILKSLMKIYKKDDFYYTWHMERFSTDSDPIERSIIIRYSGTVYMMAERIYILELEDKIKSTLSETILTPGYLANNKNLSGVSCYTTPDLTHKPVAVRVFNEYIGESINIRKSLKSCDLYPESTGEISDSIKESIELSSGGSNHFITSHLA